MPETPSPPARSPEERSRLLSAARRGLETYLATGERFEPEDPGPTEHVAGVFVTLRRGGQLRGCIGELGLEPGSLARHVIRCAVAAASSDPRFPPVGTAELPELRLEISVLSPLHPVTSPEEIVVGRDGLQLEAEGRRGLLLPQVAVEQGWDRRAFLEGVCRKAGLAPGAWRSGRLFRFSAEIFGEEPATAWRRDPRP